MIEDAMNTVKQADEAVINFDEFKQCVCNLNYLPTLEKMKQPKYNANKYLKNSTMIKEAEKEKEMCENLWTYLNPHKKDSVEKTSTFNFLLLLISNVSH